MPDPNWAHRTLFPGDNLAVRRGMNRGSVHPIATDPPFNKGLDFHATPDSLVANVSFWLGRLSEWLDLTGPV